MKEGDRIKDYLTRKQAGLFTGCIKMAFECGKVALVTEANMLDLPMSRCLSQETADGLLEMASGRDFSGIIAFSFSRGKIDRYSYARTYRGAGIESALGECKPHE